jgi:hypothetical protein
MNNDVNGYHDKDGDGTVGFVSAVLYDTMYSRDAYEQTALFAVFWPDFRK